jgi:hypothetical protein
MGKCLQFLVMCLLKCIELASDANPRALPSFLQSLICSGIELSCSFLISTLNFNGGQHHTRL